MSFKSVALVTAIIMLVTCLASCGGKEQKTASTASKTVSSQESKAEKKQEGYMNNLTGLYDLSSQEEADCRPVAVMINNLSRAQAVQTGLDGASIVYETMVEGGITRLLAIFKDVSKVGELGTVRSARYSFVDLANGHDATYFHCGLDKTYCGPYMKKLGEDDIDINTGTYGAYGYRVKNGLAKEHTMYTTGELIGKALKAAKNRTQKDSKHAELYEPWQNFVSKDAKVTLSGGAANNVSVFYSSSYVTSFAYDAASGKYVKSNKSGNNKDYRTGKTNSYDNVLVLFTDVGNFPDNYRVYSKLDGGSGYYISNGTYMKIKWTKGGTSNPIKITDENGSKVSYNPGTSYVCITSNSHQSKTTVS